jgi:hypothetical protein
MSSSNRREDYVEMVRITALFEKQVVGALEAFVEAELGERLLCVFCFLFCLQSIVSARQSAWASTRTRRRAWRTSSPSTGP